MSPLSFSEKAFDYLFLIMSIIALRDEELFFYEDGQNNIYNENGQLTYDPMEDVMSTIDDPTIVLETLVNHSSYMKNKPLEKTTN
jgi:hypothetical protein